MKRVLILISGGLMCATSLEVAGQGAVGLAGERDATLLAANDGNSEELAERLARAELMEGGDASSVPVIDHPDVPLESRIGVAFAFMTGTKAKMRATESFSTAVGPATGGRMNRTYLDGFVFLDSSDNLGEVILPTRTHNFGFDSTSQVSLATGAGTIDYHDVRLEGGSSLNPERDAFSPGWEIFYTHRLGDKRERWDRELEIGLNFLDFDYDTPSGAAIFGLLTDTYALGGVDPTVLGVPYTGAFLPAISGSPKIGDLPTRTFTTVPGTVTGKTKIDAQTLFLRLGPNLRYQSSERWFMHIMGGLTAGYYDAEVNYNEVRSLSLAGGAPIVSRLRGSFEDDDFVWGFYAAARASYRLSWKWEALAEARYTWTDSFDLADNFRSVELQMSDGIAFLLGVSYHFDAEDD